MLSWSIGRRSMPAPDSRSFTSVWELYGAQVFVVVTLGIVGWVTLVVVASG